MIILIFRHFITSTFLKKKTFCVKVRHASVSPMATTVNPLTVVTTQRDIKGSMHHEATTSLTSKLQQENMNKVVGGDVVDFTPSSNTVGSAGGEGGVGEQILAEVKVERSVKLDDGAAGVTEEVSTGEFLILKSCE